MLIAVSISKIYRMGDDRMKQTTVIQELLSVTFPDYSQVAKKQVAIEETEKQFNLLKGLNKIRKKPAHYLNSFIWSKEKTDFTTEPAVTVDAAGQVFPIWKSQLDQAMTRLSQQVRTVSVLDYGAVGDGKTDCTAAFKRAISSGRRRVIIPPGTYRTRGIKLPSYTELIGSGSGTTTLVLADSAPKRERLVTNLSYLKGNHFLRIEGLCLDWNIQRFSGAERSASGGTSSSGLTLAHVQYALVRDIIVKNPGLHGVDVTSAFYNYFGDGKRARLGSRYIWIDQVEASGFGDDGITTHHSDNILISNSFLHHPSGRAHKKGQSNSNGIEVDDGSQHVTLTNNLTAYCFGGIEIKAHETSSAASDTQIIGHYSYHDNRSYNFRHIGHHSLTDAASQSAFGIRGTYLAAYYPQYTDLYRASTPRALVISAYQKVAINQFVAEAQLPTAPDTIAISVQYRAGEVVIRNVQLKNYNDADKAIRISKTTGAVRVSEF